MIEIKKNQYTKFAQQFDKDFFDRVFAAFNNENDDPIRIYVDKENNTNIALIKLNWDQFCIIGNAKLNDYDDELADFIKNSILSEEHSTHLNLDFTSIEWEEKANRLLKDYIKYKKISLGHRLNKELFKEHLKWRDMVPVGYIIAEYNRFSDNFFDKYGKDRPFFEPESEKFGVVLIKDDVDKIISECFCVGISEDNIVEVGIDTYEEQYRRKGFAYLVASAFIEKCLSMNLEPNWHCHNADIGSKVLADKLGFEVTSSHPCSLVLREKQPNSTPLK